MRSKLKLWSAAIAACLVGAPLASANFILSANRQSIATGPNAGKEVIYWSAFNDGTNGTGTKLLGTSATMTTDANFIFRFANLDADNRLDADVIMSPAQTFNYSDGTVRPTAGFSQTATSPNIGTAIRPRGTGENFSQFTAQTFVPPNPTSNPQVQTDADGLITSATPTQDPSLTYNNTTVKAFRVDGAYLSPANAPLANTGTGSVFAISIIPSGATVTMDASLAGDTGNPQIVSLVSPGVPEPGSIALLGLGAVGFLARRRRQA